MYLMHTVNPPHQTAHAAFRPHFRGNCSPSGELLNGGPPQMGLTD